MDRATLPRLIISLTLSIIACIPLRDEEDMAIRIHRHTPLHLRHLHCYHRTIVFHDRTATHHDLHDAVVKITIILISASCLLISKITTISIRIIPIIFS